MRFKSIFSIAGLLATLTVALPEPQSPAQTTAVSLAVQSYQESLATNSVVISLVAGLATDPAAIASIASWQQSILSATVTLPPNYLDALPTQARSVFASVITVVNSIRTANGFPNGLPSGLAAATSSSKAAAAPRQTNAALGVAAAGVAAGFVGVVMAL
ncbi:uncharacterized protein BP5553_06006 [Venustampulla echinocandica]|uniref:Uncharacterized protein n=1 Tax=Venustampulla echinocandica TaxID=2656787 RepID=A0A370TMB9_9HELO|nr:uncharacterized protein BP5553_06006 [Venustampulla echinocandica]RDL36654.1 hypothetical protein BP5553_06006 [Venustampulla echinocandica]